MPGPAWGPQTNTPFLSLDFSARRKDWHHRPPCEAETSFPPLRQSAEQTFRDVWSQFFPRDLLGERVTVQADHQHALTARVEPIAGDVGTVVLEEDRAIALPLASKGGANCRTGLGSFVPASSY
jgi:hypothetical protein